MYAFFTYLKYVERLFQESGLMFRVMHVLVVIAIGISIGDGALGVGVYYLRSKITFNFLFVVFVGVLECFANLFMLDACWQLAV
jgi:hypothetical protein